MGATRSENPLGLMVRSIALPLGELVHVAAVYLGIAALVLLALCLTVPSVREQARQVHSALLAALQPDSIQNDESGTNDLAQYEMLLQEANNEAQPPQASGQEGLPPTGATTNTGATGATATTGAAAGTSPQAEAESAGGKPGATGAVKSAPALHQSFVRELKASVHGLEVKGISHAQAQALRSYIARKYKIASSVAGVLVKTAFQVGRQKHLDPQLLLAVIAIESGYNPYAESHVGAQGLMQVMTQVHIDKFDRFGEGAAAALNPIANIRVGAQILDECIKRRGSVSGGLACYVGATGPGDGGYGARVMAEQRRLALASGIPISNK
ncbi:MAG TPA: lytic transglycosylase domain-containing protein [Burkholderiaceae bacterium]|nr:lytic transglycosylase domain-containing protein [Burkholderiaceae bacterium]